MVTFKLFAGTNVGLRENNEDNFTVCPDLTKNEWIVPADCQQAIQLGDRGCLMVVADGMGGQNAGEVASAIAIDTVQEMFSIEKMSADVLEKEDNIKAFLRKVIIEADVRIKVRTKEDTSTSGMGSTIVMSWLVNKKVYVAWLGDSRAYSFIPDKGIARLSKDHSYVQQLVDAGTLTDLEAMNHPNSNIITRSLGDTSQKAKPDVDVYDITNGEILLLCSDGLCGVCRDEEIGGILEEHEGNLALCKDKLTTAALAAGGSDNITISLMQLTCDSTTNSQNTEDEPTDEPKKSKWLKAIIAGAIFLLAVLSYVGYSIFKGPKEPKYKISLSFDKDTLEFKKTLKFEVRVEGQDSSYSFQYDKSLLKIDNKKGIVSANKEFSADTTILVTAVCSADSSIHDSKPLTIKRKVIEEIELDVVNLPINLSTTKSKKSSIKPVESHNGTTPNLDNLLTPSDVNAQAETNIVNPKDSTKNKK